MQHDVEKNVKPYEQTFNTMVPSPFVKFMRKCVIWQFIRFVIINVKMIIVVSKSH